MSRTRGAFGILAALGLRTRPPKQRYVSAYQRNLNERMRIVLANREREKYALRASAGLSPVRRGRWKR